jgi:hypothetical protein
MKNTLILLFLFCFSAAVGQELTIEQKDSIKTILDKIVENDQKYRLLLPDFDKAQQDSIDKLPVTTEGGMKVKVIKGEEWGYDKKLNDSLWQIINEIDSLNKQTFLLLIKKYGYPSYRRVGTTACGILTIHMMGEKDFNELLPVFQQELKKGNMTANDYANWHDRHQLFMGKKKLYGVYDPDYPCVESVKKTNKERKKIGIHKLYKENRCREEVGIFIK